MARESQEVALDGNAQHELLVTDPEAGVVHALRAFGHDDGIVLSQTPIENPTAKAAGGIQTIGAQPRHFSAHPEEVVSIVLGFSPQNA